MRMLRDRNDGMLLGAAGIMVAASALVAIATGSFVNHVDYLLTSTAHAAAAVEMPLAHNRTPESLPASIIRAPTDLPAAVGDRAPETVRVALETIERMGNLADGTTYRYWTFGGQVPGPFVRVKVGDTVEVSLKNHEDSWMQHNVDFHAVTGPGGGGIATVADPGATKGFSFKALNPGLFVYHCAVPIAAQHISNGMYGLILVEPGGGLPKVDHEFYVMQGELYTEQKFGEKGELSESYDKLMDETPTYYVFNGAANALAGDNALH